MAVWTVPGTVTRVVDGDTVVCRLDLGWRVARWNEPIRVYGIDTPEMNTAEGKFAKVYAEGLLPVGTLVSVVSLRLLGEFDKYGRTLAALTLPDGTDYAAAMIAAGHATPYP